MYDTKPVKPDDPELLELKAELEGPPYGYRLRIMRRMPHWRKVEASRKDLRKQGSVL